MRYVLFFLFIPFTFPAVAQSVSQDLSGNWSGLLFQNEGGFADRFELFFDVEQIGLSLKGTATVRLGNLTVVMKLTGSQSPAGNWRLTETEILRSNKDGLDVAWCMKEYDLRVDYREGELVLTGPWWGSSEYGACVPGSITLKRRLKVASLFFGGQYSVNLQPHG